MDSRLRVTSGTWGCWHGSNSDMGQYMQRGHNYRMEIGGNRHKGNSKGKTGMRAFIRRRQYIHRGQ